MLSQVVKRSSTALLAAAFVGIVPSYISRSVAGSYDNEGVAIFALIFTFYFWVKAVKTGSMLWAIGCALAYFYMVAAWGGYVFIINIIPIYVVILIVSGRYSSRLYVAYSTFYVVGSLMAMQVPFVGFNVIKQAECLASHGAFAVLHRTCVAAVVLSCFVATVWITVAVCSVPDRHRSALSNHIGSVPLPGLHTRCVCGRRPCCIPAVLTGKLFDFLGLPHSPSP
jgi:asparagine N-glycosylation enzyme membrane subunit Stt3